MESILPCWKPVVFLWGNLSKDWGTASLFVSTNFCWNFFHTFFNCRCKSGKSEVQVLGYMPVLSCLQKWTEGLNIHFQIWALSHWIIWFLLAVELDVQNAGTNIEGAIYTHKKEVTLFKYLALSRLQEPAFIINRLIKDAVLSVLMVFGYIHVLCWRE